MGAIASQITSPTIVYSIVYSSADQRKHQSSASLAFVWGIHRGPVNSPHKWPVTRKMSPFDDVIMSCHITDFNQEEYGPPTNPLTSYSEFKRKLWQCVFIHKPQEWLVMFMMTSPNGNIFHVRGHLCGEFTGHCLILYTKATDAELRCFSDLHQNQQFSKQCRR